MNRDAAPAYSGRPNSAPLPKEALPRHGMDGDSAYRLIHDELLLDGSSRLNLATFVTTWMEPQADRLMAESFDKNMIDKDEYPQTAEIERRCVNIVSDLFHAPGDPVGVSTIGSSEAVMLAGLAMKWRWRTRRGFGPTDAQRPNLVLGSNVQVVWEKFCRYWDVEPRYIPMTPDCNHITPPEVMARVDDDTIGVVAILGTTFTGEYEPIEAIHDALARYNLDGREPGPAPRRRRERRLRRTVPPTGPRVGLSPPVGEVHQRLRPQVRPHVPRRWLRGMARRRGPTG